MNRTAALVMTLFFLALLGGAGDRAAAQSTTTGVLGGAVVDDAGRPVAGAQVTLRPVDGGLSRIVEAGPDGGFFMTLLETGEYELLAERLGYQPVVVTPIPVMAGRRVDARAVLEPAEGAVAAPDTVSFRGAALATGSLAGRTRRIGEWELRSVPQRQGSLDELVRLSSYGDRPLEVEGLPATLGGFVVGGLPYRSAHHPADPAAAAEAPLFPVMAADGAELVVGRPHIESPSAAGALLTGELRRVGSGVHGELGGFYSPGPLVLGLDDFDASPTAFRGSALMGGAMASDSAHALVFVEGQQHSLPVRYWPRGATELAAGLAEAGVDVSDIDQDDVAQTQRLSLGGSFDWRFAGGQRIDVLALYGRTEREQSASSLHGYALPVAVDGQHFMTAATATGPITESIAVEVRVGVSQSSREYGDAGVVDPGIDGPVAFVGQGAQLGDPAFPASLDRSSLDGQATFHYRTGEHHLKAGLGGRYMDHTRSHVFGGAGLYLFDDATAFDDRTGAFRGLEGPAAAASFSVAEGFVYGQDTWRAAPGLDLTTGVRYELETVPANDLLSNQRWQELTGIDNAGLPDRTGDLAVAAGFDWNVREHHAWRVQGGVAVQRGDIPAELLAEVLTHDGRFEAVAALGDVAEVTELGPRLSILSSGFRPPVTSRASFGVSRALGSTAALHVAGVLRQTKNLPRRTDLNLPLEAPFEDQHGRPVFGELERVGGLLLPVGGLNRRFAEFEAVSAITSEATSTYWGVTAGLEKRYGDLRLDGSYTYSRTEDDWLGAASGQPLDALPPFPGASDLEGWEEGTSDFDVPHRLVFAAELTPSFADRLSLGGFLKWASGRPFTPGLGRGIDANADGVSGNDPAFIDDAVEGLADLQASWPCLREFNGRFVERNACRMPDRTVLDLWLGLRLPLQRVQTELRVEALALDHGGGTLVETALYRLDPDGEFTTDSSTGQVHVPLAINPRFGEELGQAAEFARIRISLRMRF